MNTFVLKLVCISDLSIKSTCVLLSLRSNIISAKCWFVSRQLLTTETHFENVTTLSKYFLDLVIPFIIFYSNAPNYGVPHPSLSLAGYQRWYSVAFSVKHHSSIRKIAIKYYLFSAPLNHRRLFDNNQQWEDNRTSKQKWSSWEIQVSFPLYQFDWSLIFSGVGKTSIIQRHDRREFTAETSATIGANFIHATMSVLHLFIFRMPRKKVCHKFEHQISEFTKKRRSWNWRYGILSAQRDTHAWLMNQDDYVC